MLPSSRDSLKKAGFTGTEAMFIMIACMTGGFLIILVMSRFVHEHTPSYEVDCDHSHADPSSANHSHRESRKASHLGHNLSRPDSADSSHERTNGDATEFSPLLANESDRTERSRSNSNQPTTPRDCRRRSSLPERRPSMKQIKSRVMSFVKDAKRDCDVAGPCRGYTDPCGQECYRYLLSKTPSATKKPVLAKSMDNIPTQNASRAPNVLDGCSPNHGGSVNGVDAQHSEGSDGDASYSSDSDDLESQQHHHHVSENAFLSLGLQTSMAIALHKLPEGFITYATNHANPNLGLAVFLALFFHNISEGFAMALPLYLALNSRPKALAWSSLLGGISQPFGAGIAWLWFTLVGTDHEPGNYIYGCMYGITGGIMICVAIMLSQQALTMNNNKSLCLVFAFLGMIIMLMCRALTET
jgi:ZIP family zinc transporter